MLSGERSTGSNDPEDARVDALLQQPAMATGSIYGETGEGLPPAEFAKHSKPENDTPKRPVSRRTILKCAGFAALGMIVTERLASEVGDMYEKQHWGNNPPEFTNGTPELPTTGGNEIILFGGFGEYDTTSYAEGLGKKLNTPTRTIGFRYPAQGYQLGEIGAALYEHLRESKPDKVALDLTSMGAETGLSAFSWVNENKQELDKQWNIDHGEKSHNPAKAWDIPPVSLIAANGSPAGLENAAMKDIVNLMLYLHDTTGYEPGIGSEWLYECLDDDNGWQKTLGVKGPKAMGEQWIDGFRRTINGFPPEVAISQARALQNFNREQTFNNLRGCVGPFTTFCYMNAKNWRDNVVNERASSANLIESVKSIGVDEIKVISTGMPYHASHWGADRYLPDIIDDAFNYTHKYLSTSRHSQVIDPDVE